MILDKIVEHINTKLQSEILTGKAFQKGVFYGLAKQVKKDDDTAYPVAYDLTGKETNCTINDTFPFQLYHRCLGVTSKPERTNFGNGNNDISATFSMIAVVYGDVKRLGLIQEDLALMTMTGFPTMLTKTEMGNLPVNKINISLTAENNNSLAVFTGEYLGGTQTLNPLSIYFSLSYLIEIGTTRKCISCAEC